MAIRTDWSKSSLMIGNRSEWKGKLIAIYEQRGIAYENERRVSGQSAVTAADNIMEVYSILTKNPTNLRRKHKEIWQVEKVDSKSPFGHTRWCSALAPKVVGPDYFCTTFLHSNQSNDWYGAALPMLSLCASISFRPFAICYRAASINQMIDASIAVHRAFAIYQQPITSSRGCKCLGWMNFFANDDTTRPIPFIPFASSRTKASATRQSGPPSIAHGCHTRPFSLNSPGSWSLHSLCDAASSKRSDDNIHQMQFWCDRQL